MISTIKEIVTLHFVQKELQRLFVLMLKINYTDQNIRNLIKCIIWLQCSVMSVHNQDDYVNSTN